MNSFVLKGHFANAVVGFLDFFIYKDYDVALNVYQQVFRKNMKLSTMIVISIILLIMPK